ncbi:MAG TPA: hypothetical protein VED24_04145 [Candidatus Acidoferrum sp.]|nr:hypothetical protein [Candidatus Acidoferrum sp.]
MGDEETPVQQLTIDIQVGRSIYSVDMQSPPDTRSELTTHRILFTTDAPDSMWVQVSCEIIKLCELGNEVKKLGLTKEDLDHVERHLVINRSDVRVVIEKDLRNP